MSLRSYNYVYRQIKEELCLSSMSGGTDIVSCFVSGNPTLPVVRGRMQSKSLGMAVEVWDDNGQPVLDAKGELVCTRHFPAIPVGLWNDPRGEKLKASYFSQFPGVWAQGDYAEEFADGGMVIHGRSDAVLNPGGVRIGTAEIYRQVEKVEQVLESIAIGQQWQSDVRVVLFVRPARWRRTGRGPGATDPPGDPRQHHASACTGEDPRGHGHPADPQRQDRGTGGA